MNLNHRITSLKQANNFLNMVTSGKLNLKKGKDYFYFVADKGKLPESFMTKSIKNIWLNDLIQSAECFNKSIGDLK